jgi:hypothetical protein
MILGRIDLLVAWEYVETRHMKNGLLKGVALAAIVGADTDILLNVDTVTDTGALPTC